MRHTIYEKRINPTLWRDPIPVDPEQIPVLGREDYEARIQALWQMPQASEYDTILIYGDREHFSNVEYFTGYDPRWEETLLILPRGGKPSILVGNEGIGYIAVSPVEMNIEFYQTFSLMGQPNDARSRRLEEILKDAIALQSGKLGVIGFKSYDPALHTIGAFVTDVPHYISRIYFMANIISFPCTSYCQNYSLSHSIASFMYCGTTKVLPEVSI